MQHKSLLAALMVGVLALASCVKNEESQSVTDMRNARADEIKSQAELNRANAQAAITLAQAQKAIAEAQAKLLEAQAAIAEAEAAKIAVEAELAGIEVQIAAVKLEVEKVNLQAKKAELEALKAKYEAEIAKYNAEKQEAINKLEAAEAQAEIDEIKAQIELLKQEEKLLKAAGALSAEQQKQIGEAWNNYAAQVAALNKAQTELISKMAQLAKLQAGEETAEEILVKKIQDVQTKIYAQQIYIEELESKVNLSAAEIDAMITVARAALSDAYTDELQAQEAMQLIEERLSAKKTAVYAYQEGWTTDDQDGFADWFEGLPSPYYYYDNGNKVNVFAKTYKYNEETGRWERGFQFFYGSKTNDSQILEGTFYPVYTVDSATGNPGNKFEIIEGEKYLYPGYIDGVEAASVTLQDDVIAPAMIYTPNLEYIVGYVQYIEENTNAAAYYQAMMLDPWVEEDVQDMQETIQQLALEMTAHKEYVEKAEIEILPAKQAWNDAKANEESVAAELVVAQDNYSYYLNSHDVSDKAKNEVDAFATYVNELDNLETAQESFDKASTVLYGTVPDATEAVDNEGEGAVEGLVDKVARLEDESYKAGLDVAEKKADLDKKQKEFDEANEGGKLENALKEAKDALADQEKEVLKKQDEADEALEAYHKAEIIYTADPTDANKEAMETAKKTWEDAVKAISTEQEKLPDLEKAVADAQAAWDKVFDPFDKAQKAYYAAWEIATKIKAEWETAKEKLGKRSDDASATGSAYAQYKWYAAALGNIDDLAPEQNTAYGWYNKAVADLEAAQEANPDGAEELIQLRTAIFEAIDAYGIADAATKKAKEDYEALYKGEDPKYPSYVAFKNHITPAGADAFEDETVYLYEYYLAYGAYPWYLGKEVDMPGQKLQQYYWWQEKLEALMENYQEVSEQLTKAYQSADFDKLFDQIEGYAAEEDTYFEHIAAIQDLMDAKVEANKTIYDAMNARIKAEAALTALNQIKSANMYSSDGTTPETIAKYEAKIKEAQETLKDLEKDLQHLINELYFGKKDPATGEYTYAKIAELQNDIEKLQNEIEFRSEMIDYYLGIITALLGEDGGIE